MQDYEALMLVMGKTLPGFTDPWHLFQFTSKFCDAWISESLLFWVQEVRTPNGEVFDPDKPDKAFSSCDLHPITNSPEHWKAKSVFTFNQCNFPLHSVILKRLFWDLWTD